MGLFQVIWGWLTGGGIGGAVTAIMSIVSKVSDNDTTKKVAELQANTAIWHDRVDLIKSVKLIQILIALALLPPIIHQGAIYLDSTPFPYLAWDTWWWRWTLHDQGSWKVVRAPAPYDEREWVMISSLIGIQSGLTIAMGWLTKLGK